MARLKDPELDDSALSDDTELEREAGRLDQVAPHQGFFEYIAGLSEADWESHIIYVYRLQPLTDRFAGGEATKFITKYTHAVDEDLIKQEHGSGKYRLLLNKLVGASKKSRPIKRVEIAIMDPKSPPKIPPGEWLDDPRNRQWAWAREALEEQAKAKAPEQPLGTGTGPMNAAEFFRAVREIVREVRPDVRDNTAQEALTKAVIDTMATANKQSFEMLRSQYGSQEPAQLISLVKELAAAIVPPHDAAPEHLLEIVLKMQADTQKQLAEAQSKNLELVLKVVEAKSSAPADTLVDNLRKLAELRDLFEGGGRGGKIGVLETIAPYVPQALGEVRGIIHEAVGLSRGVPAAALATPPPSASGVPGASPVTNPTAVEPLDAQVAQFAHFVPALAGPLLQALSVGKNGEEFAEDLSEFLGPVLYQQLRALGEEKLLALLRTHAPLWAQLAPMEQQVRGFVAEFVRWQPEAEPEERQPEVVTPSGKRRKAAVQ